MSERAETAATFAFLLFEALDTTFALPIAHVRSTARLGTLTSTPLAPRHMLGLANLRGEIVAVVCLARRLDPLARPVDSGGFAIVLEVDGETFALAARGLGEVVRARRDQILAAPENIDARRANAISGLVPVGDAFAQILDPAKLLGVAEHDTST